MARPARVETVLASSLKCKSHYRLYLSVKIKQLVLMALNDRGHRLRSGSPVTIYPPTKSTCVVASCYKTLEVAATF